MSDTTDTELALMFAPADHPVILPLRLKAEQYADEMKALSITNLDEAGTATKYLGDVAALVREATAAMKTMKKPQQERIDQIDQAFKAVLDPIRDADRTLRDRVLTFQTEQNRLARLEAARLEEEARRRRDAQEKAILALQTARAAAAGGPAAAKARLAEVERAVESCRAALDSATDLGQFHEAQDQLAEAEGLLKTVRANAETAINVARVEVAQAEEVVRQVVTAPPPAPTLFEAKTIRADGADGAKATVKEKWTFRVLKLEDVPRAYLKVQIDMAAVRRSIGAGVREIAGLEIFPEPTLAVTTSRK